MFQLNEELIKKYANELTYKRGLEYYLKNKVCSIDIDDETDRRFNSAIKAIYGEVESSNNEEVYDVSANFHESVGIFNTQCDCYDFWEHHGGEGLCKHLVALLLKYKDDHEYETQQVSMSKNYNLIEQLKKNMGRLMVYDKKQIKLEVKFEFEASSGERQSSVELKIGENKTYVVRNMRDFLQTVRSKTAKLEFGKGFTYDPFIHDFSDEDKNLIDLLIEIYETDARVSDMSQYYYSGYRNMAPKFLSGKKAYLTSIQLKRFLRIMEGRNLDAIIGLRECPSLNIYNEDLPLEFSLSINEDRIEINSKEDTSLPVPLTEDGEYFFFKNNIYKPSKEQTRLYVPFYNEFIKSKGKPLVFDKEEGEKIASYIVPSLRKISKNVNIDKKLESDFYEEPLKVNFYLDKDNKDITLDIIFKYGNKDISAFNDKINNEEKKILIRDIDEEFKILNLIECLGFTKGKQYFILKGEEKLVELLTEGINKLQDIGEVYYSESFKNIKIYGASNIKSSVRLNNNDLLEFNFNIEGVDKKELRGIFEALKEKKKYYKLKKGGFVGLESKELQDVGNLIEYLDVKDSDLEKEKILLSKYNAMYIDNNLKENSMTFIERNKSFRELVNNIRDIQDMDYEVPEHLDKIMRNYQKFGYKWFNTLASCNFGGILADEMGLGKTLQAISFIETKSKEEIENKKPSLVIAPTSLVYNWKSEIEKFAPNLKAVVVSGSKSEREEQRKEIEETDVVITSYPLIRRDIEEYKTMEFNYCFLDEAQQIKNPASMNAQSVKELKAKGYFALTGTPIENSLTELWSIFDFIMPGYLMTQGKFSKKYEVPIVKGKDKKALEELNKHIKPFILRRLKKEVIKELPPKIEHKIIVEMTEEQKKLYSAYVASVKGEIEEEIKEKGFNKSKFKILTALTRLRQICCEPSVFVENFEGESGKMLALDDILEESIQGGHRVLLFSQFTSVLKNIIPRLEKNNIEYLYLDGQTKSEDRGAMVREFNEGKGEVFLISLKAGGTGLNLTGADTVIHFDPWWNPAVEDQASDRAHRIGQKKAVEVIKLIARGSIEEKIYDLQEKKKEIIKSVMGNEKDEEVLITQMTEEELQELFRL